jgi:glycosyltransferase involved in cell wall biosynthesis
MPLRIAIDASRATVDHMTGTEYYSRELIRHLITLNETLEKPHHLDLFFREQPQGEIFPESHYVAQHVIPFPRLWTHWRLAASLFHEHPDLTFVPAHTLPLVFPGNSVVTVHDLGYKYFPEAHTEAQRRYLDFTTRYSANRATIILADSQATAEDLSEFYDVPPEKIRVVYPGVERPVESLELEIFRKYRIPFRYILFLGTLQPRKNIKRIVEAYSMWRDANPDKRTALVLAGKKGWLFDDAWIKDVEGVYVTGYIDEADKGDLIRHAIALIFPSLYEGFGFPVVEAMWCNTPVIASDTSSLPELVDDAGMLVNPLEVAEIAAAMDLLTQTPYLRKKLGIKGLAQAAKFTWKRAAEQTMEALEAAGAAE